MKSTASPKKPFGTATMIAITHARYLSWADAFEIEFEDGLSFLEPHRTIRRASHISRDAVPVTVTLEPETSLGFEVRYDTGETAEVSWAFIREMAPEKNGLKKAPAAKPCAPSPSRLRRHRPRNSSSRPV